MLMSSLVVFACAVLTGGLVCLPFIFRHVIWRRS